MNETIKCTCASATPVADPNLTDILQDTAKAVKESLDGFSDKMPSEEEVVKAKNFLGSFTNYIKGNSFKEDINDMSRKYNVPPKKLAQNFFERALGTVGDVLGIAIGTVCNAGHTLVDILTTIAHGAVNLICKVANALARMVTLNKSCVAAV